MNLYFYCVFACSDTTLSVTFSFGEQFHRGDVRCALVLLLVPFIPFFLDNQHFLKPELVDE